MGSTEQWENVWRSLQTYWGTSRNQEGSLRVRVGGGRLLKTLIKADLAADLWMFVLILAFCDGPSIQGLFCHCLKNRVRTQWQRARPVLEWLRPSPTSVGHGLMEDECGASFSSKGLPIAFQWASTVTLHPSSHSYPLSTPCSSLPGPGQLDRKLTSSVPAGAWDSRDKLISRSKKITKLLSTLGVSAVWDPSISWKAQKFPSKIIKKEMDVFFWTLDKKWISQYGSIGWKILCAK